LIENDANLGFGGGLNVGLRALLAAEPPDYVILLNQDTVVAPGWLATILEPFDDTDVGAVGCKLLYPDGKTIQHAGAYLEYPRAIAQHLGWHQPDVGQYDQTRDVEYVTAAALALRVAALQEVGIFDEGYNPGYYEDTDLLWRLRQAQYRVVYTGAASSLHLESTSSPDIVRRSKLYNRNRLRFVLKTYPGAAFWQDFVPAERMFIAQHGVADEARALRWAYLHALIALPDILAARGPLHPEDSLDQKEVGRLLLSLRRMIGDCERARLAAVA
jgi:GT2 family glycosyltransferase